MDCSSENLSGEADLKPRKSKRPKPKPQKKKARKPKRVPNRKATIQRIQSDNSIEVNRTVVKQPAKRVYVPKTEVKKTQEQPSKSNVYDFISHEPLKDHVPGPQPADYQGATNSKLEQYQKG